MPRRIEDVGRSAIGLSDVVGEVAAGQRPAGDSPARVCYLLRDQSRIGYDKQAMLVGIPSWLRTGGLLARGYFCLEELRLAKLRLEQTPLW
ncbi:hypothetical protein HG15A2_47050 [Adhaeretor mobilis]|uniref:Uncharacterized protein n=1 Tax=Adhaeretor mobilis TaxID=1930276 RepID=A0A517N2K8_9BACT|nr:hypothetical protein HG15A2_47050 [Adhaeretor mobilis]